MDYYSSTMTVLGLLAAAAAGFVLAYWWARRRFLGWSRSISELHRRDREQLEGRLAATSNELTDALVELDEIRANWTEALSANEAAEARATAAEARCRSVVETSKHKADAQEKELAKARSDYQSAVESADAVRAGVAGIRAEYEIQIAALRAEATEWRTETETWQAKLQGAQERFADAETAVEEWKRTAAEWQAKAIEWQAKAGEWQAMSELATELVPDEAESTPLSVEAASAEEIEDYKRTIATWESHARALSAEYEGWRTSMETELNTLRANLTERNEAIARLEADAALLSHLRQSMRERQTRIDGLDLQIRQLREELAAVRANLADRNETVARLEADAALLSHLRQSMRERQTRIDGLQLQLTAARAASHPSSEVAEKEIRTLQERVRELEAEARGESTQENLQLRLRVASLRGIRFLPDSAEILPESLPAIDNAAIALTAVRRGVRVEIAGHTDSIGDEAHNQRLSQERADSVRSYLISRGVREELLTAVGYGGTRPIADNALDDGRFANRRIDFVVR